MTTRGWLLAAALIAVLLPASASAGIDGPDHDVPDWKNVKAVPMVTGLLAPSNFVFAPDGSIWFSEVFDGNVSRYDAATGKVEFKRHFNNVNATDERGLTGLALDPNFKTNGVYYVTYTEPNPQNASLGTNKLVRVENGQETVIITWSGFEEHNGGRIIIVNDGTMFVSTGENQKRDPAQDPKSLLGKILHMTLDGKGVAGNLDGLVYSKGHRNVYGLAYDEPNKQLYATENSGWRRDEINKIVPGGNYGYPECEGLGLNGVNTPCPKDKGYIEPMMTFYEDHTAAPTGAVIWKGELYWASLREGSIHRIWNDTGTWKDEKVYDAEDNLLDLRVSPQGKLYYAGYEGIYRLDFPGDTDPSPVKADEHDGGHGITPKLTGVPAPTFPLALVGIALLALVLRRRA